MDKVQRVIISILNWNGLEDTRECIQSINKINYPNFKVLIIDNDSSNNEAEQIRREFGNDVTVIRSPTNKGFAGGHNIGIKYAEDVSNGDYILLLNNDTSVEPDFLSDLITEVEEREDVAAAGPLILTHDDHKTMWSAGLQELSVSRPFANVHVNNKRMDVTTEPYFADGVIGCTMLIDLDCIDDVGLLDDNFFLLHEESDWCKRARTAGYRCLIVPKSIVYHKVSSSLNKVPSTFAYYDVRNRILFFKKHSSIKTLPQFLKGFLFHVYLHYGRRQLAGGTISAIVLGGIDGILGRPPRYIPG